MTPKQLRDSAADLARDEHTVYFAPGHYRLDNGRTYKLWKGRWRLYAGCESDGTPIRPCQARLGDAVCRRCKGHLGNHIDPGKMTWVGRVAVKA